MRPDGTIVWLHGTSVGESVAALALANSMKKNGFGKETSNNGDIFSGNFAYDIKDGSCIYTFKANASNFNFFNRFKYCHASK